MIEDIAIERDKPLSNKRPELRAEGRRGCLRRGGVPVGRWHADTDGPGDLLAREVVGRSVRWQVEARHALLTGGHLPEPVVNPFFENGPANKIMTAALMTPGQKPGVAGL